ncbi:MAG: DUF499 domain-containing protein, partial [Planctomycetes bacterium]|nr:DUF499 domain-containing protein [Planctomycetota bacterium]
MIELRRKDKSGAAELPAADILDITYPTADVRSALAVLAGSQGRPIVLIGDRGRGKSHILAVLHHALQSPDVVEQWARGWAGIINDARFTGLKLPRNFQPITEVMSDQEYATLWDLIFAEHPDGKLYQGRFIQAGTQIPARSLMEQMFEKRPTALVLDELQSWYDGLTDEAGEGGRKLAKWAFSFIQMLSEIAHDRPDALVLIASVRTNQTEAFRQIHRVNPVLVDFGGPTAKDDRKRLILHRLFENRAQIGENAITPVTRAHAAERRRLLFEHVAGAEYARLDREVAECWPFGPELLDLLEDNVLMSSAAQETRDLIKILAQLFRARGEAVPLLTAADLYVDDDSCGVASLLNSISTAGIHDQLRDFANRNLEAIRDAGVAAPHARELISAIWVHSLAPDDDRGATAQQLQVGITRDAAIDDNAFAEEMGRIADNAFKIHRELTGKRRFYLSLEDNAETKLKANARNDKTFESGQDKQFLRDTLTHLLASPEGATQAPCRVIVLDAAWETAPWANVKEADRPDRWDRQVLLVIPDPIGHPAEVLGPWLATHVQQRRNTIRFLLPAAGQPGLYADQALIFLARCASLGKTWMTTDRAYAALHTKYDGDLRKQLGERFDRVAVIHRWNFQSPKSCEFDDPAVNQTGAKTPGEVERIVRENLFDQTDFTNEVLAAATAGQTMKDLLTHLREPPVKPDQDAIAYLGDTPIYEQVLRIAAQGRIAVNVGGRWFTRRPNDSDTSAEQWIRSNAFRTGREMEEVQLGPTTSVAGGGVTVVAPPTPPTPTPVGPGPGPVQPPARPVGPGPGPGPGPLFPPAAPPIVKKTDAAKTGVNLLGDVERWQIRDGVRVMVTKLTLRDISKDELKALLQR